MKIITKGTSVFEAERTGTTAELSNRLGISVRTVFNYISFMKSELEAPIVFNSQTKNYNERVCELCFKG